MPSDVHPDIKYIDGLRQRVESLESLAKDSNRSFEQVIQDIIDFFKEKEPSKD